MYSAPHDKWSCMLTAWTSFLILPLFPQELLLVHLPHSAKEAGFLSNQNPPQEQHVVSTPECLAIGTSFLTVSLNGEPILLCSPHTMGTQHCKNTVMRCWYFYIPSYVCWWGEQLKLPNIYGGSNTRSLVSPRSFSKFLALLLIVLIDPTIPLRHCICTHNVQVADVGLSHAHIQ